MKFISSTGGVENFFANVSKGYAQGMYYLSSSELECIVEKSIASIVCLFFNFAF